MFFNDIQIESITTLAGAIKEHEDGKETKKFNFPIGMCLNPLDSCLYICDRDSNEIKRVTMQGILSWEKSEERRESGGK